MKPDTAGSRREFFLIASGAVAAALAVSDPVAAADLTETLEARVTELEDVNVLRALHARLIQHINAGSRDALSALFTDSSKTQLDGNVRRLTAEPPGGAVEVSRAADGKTATLREICVVLSGEPMKSDCMLVQMARAQGEGFVRRTERRMLETTYVKKNGVWKIDGATLFPV